MTEREGGDGTTDAPRVEGRETRADGGEAGPRRVGDVRRDHEAESNSSRAAYDADRGTSWTSVMLCCWLAALSAGRLRRRTAR